MFTEIEYNDNDSGLSRNQIKKMFKAAKSHEDWDVRQSSWEHQYGIDITVWIESRWDEYRVIATRSKVKGETVSVTGVADMVYKVMRQHGLIE